MSDIWPDNLVEELAYRRCLIFLGSGISATAKNDAGESPDTWGAFLNNVKLKMKNPSEDDKKFVEDMLKTINEQIQNIAQKKDTLCRRMYN